jgi:hypothetical protein
VKGVGFLLFNDLRNWQRWNKRKTEQSFFHEYHGMDGINAKNKCFLYSVEFTKGIVWKAKFITVT